MAVNFIDMFNQNEQRKKPQTMATQDELNYKQKMADLLYKKASNTAPVQHWSEGATRLVEGFNARNQRNELDAARSQNAEMMQEQQSGANQLYGQLANNPQFDQQTIMAMLKNPQTREMAQKLIIQRREQMAQANKPMTPAQQAELELKRSKIGLNNANIDKIKAGQLAASQKASAGDETFNSLMGAVNGLQAKIGDKGSEQERLFEEATGPLADSYLARGIKSAIPGQQQDVTLLRSIKQDAQAVNSLLQKALLKGGGSITENERAQINQILGNISTANSAEEARTLTNNFKVLISRLFNKGGATQQPVTQQPIPRNAIEQELKRRGLK